MPKFKNNPEPDEETVESLLTSEGQKHQMKSWGYSMSEGGQIYLFKAKKDEETIERFEREVKNINNWGSYPWANPFGSGSRNYTITKLIPNHKYLRVFAIFFPDGRVWDSHYRKFRAR